MVTIRLWLEVPSPTGEGMERLPILPGELMVPSIDEIFSVDVEQIEVNGEPNDVQAVRSPGAGGRIRLSLLGTADDLTDGALKTLVVDIVEEAGEEPRKEAPLLTKSHGPTATQ